MPSVAEVDDVFMADVIDRVGQPVRDGVASARRSRMDTLVARVRITAGPWSLLIVGFDPATGDFAGVFGPAEHGVHGPLYFFTPSSFLKWCERHGVYPVRDEAWRPCRLGTWRRSGLV